MNSSPLHPAQACLEQGATRTGPATFRRPIAQMLAFALVATFGVYGLSDPSQGQSSPPRQPPPRRSGAWRVRGAEAARSSFASGSREQARCRAHYSRASKNSYRVNATCATASGKAAQTATVHKVGENKYSGNFHNPDYDITGTISVIVNGNSQSVRLTSSSGWAHIRLSR